MTRKRRLLPLKAERGNASVLTIGVSVVVLMVIALGVATTGVEIDRNRLQFVADGAALYAAAGTSESTVYDGAGDPRVPTLAEARERAETYLAVYPEKFPRVSEMSIVSLSLAPSGEISLTLEARVHPPLASWISRALDSPITVHVRSTAHAH
ncbi:pilus assembly protein TadG-related protein [Dermabacter sp. p3-SID358]|uniref:pilus assembly protein TadG-related protein n=1 Tax=Dermabacter sp. p3-SID358 TaxID=2916114 RepID=UPI0021A7A746|nr:pilus assembly protein TadG-related protein [Dermabacter sp. p3-SID358]MCT1866752.1 pilus assembly protein TadG-related protein [Dermabacter sp. p3-SID358]